MTNVTPTQVRASKLRAEFRVLLERRDRLARELKYAHNGIGTAFGGDASTWQLEVKQSIRLFRATVDAIEDNEMLMLSTNVELLKLDDQEKAEARAMKPDYED